MENIMLIFINLIIAGIDLAGCSPTYELKIQSDPKQSKNDWIYEEVKIISKTYRLFYIKLYTKYY